MKMKDLKPLLLEKGERIGLYVAAGLAVLLVGMGVLNGMKAGSPTENAKKLTDQATALQSKRQSARPSEGGQDMPPAIRDDVEKLKFKEIVAAEYPSQAAFLGVRLKDNKRQKPTILPPEDYAVECVRAQLPGLVFQVVDRGGRKEITHVTMLDAPPMTAAGAMGAAGAIGAPGGAPPGFGGLLGQSGGAGALGAQGGAGAGGQRPRYNPRKPKDPRATSGGLKTTEIEISQVDGKKDKVFAIRALPLRMGVITASFPYRKQVDEYRDKLRKNSRVDVLTETVVDSENKPLWNSFQFKGVIVERAEFDPAKPGNQGVLLENWKPREEDWLSLPIEDAYRWILVNVRRQVEDDPKEHFPVTQPGMALKFPKALDPGFKYPDLTTRLKGVSRTLKTLESLSQEEQKKAIPPSSLSGRDFDIFNPGANTGSNQSPPPKPSDATVKDEFLIEHCLLRFLDINDDDQYVLKPGRAYRYRFKIRMANPNYSEKPSKRTDTYYDLAVDKEIVSDWNYVSSRDSNNNYLWDRDIVVPADTFYYATDSPLPGTPKPPAPAPNEAVFQFHRWTEDYVAKPGATPTPLGEWVIAPRVVIRRGEYVKSKALCEVPVKEINQLNFAVYPKEPITFGDELPWNGSTPGVYPVLVDFEGGRTTYQRYAPPRKEGDTTPPPPTYFDDVKQEVLILLPDGRVEAHHGAVDEKDTTRIERVTNHTSRVNKLKSGGGAAPVLGN